MGIWANYYGVDEGTALRFAASADTFAFLSAELVSNRQVLSHDLDKAWDGLHFVLTGAASVTKPDVPGSYVIRPTHDLGVPDGFVGYHTAAEVAEIVRFLQPRAADATAAKATVDAGLHLASMAAADLYPDIWDEERADLLEEFSVALLWLWDFYRTAASFGLAVIVGIY